MAIGSLLDELIKLLRRAPLGPIARTIDEAVGQFNIDTIFYLISFLFITSYIGMLTIETFSKKGYTTNFIASSILAGIVFVLTSDVYLSIGLVSILYGLLVGYSIGYTESDSTIGSVVLGIIGVIVGLFGLSFAINIFLLFEAPTIGAILIGGVTGGGVLTEVTDISSIINSSREKTKEGAKKETLRQKTSQLVRTATRNGM